MTKAEKLLLDIAKRAGVPEDKLKPFEGTDEAAMDAVDAEEIVQDIINASKGVLENDSDFTGGIESRVRGKILNEKQTHIIREMKAALGVELSKAEIDALPEKERFDSVVKLLVKKAKEKAPGSDSDAAKENEKLQVKIAELEGQIQKMRDEEMPALETKYQQEMREKEIASLLNGEILKRKDQLVSGSAAFMRTMVEDIKGTYDIVTKDDGTVEIQQKGKGLKVMNGTKPMTLDEAITSILTKNEAIKKQDPPPGKGPIHTQGPPPQKPEIRTPGMKKAQEALEKKQSMASTT